MDNMPLVPLNAASITAAKTVACGAVQIELSAAVQPKKIVFYQMMMRLVQHLHFIQPQSCATGYRCLCSSRLWLASSVGTLPSFFQGWGVACTAAGWCISAGAPPRSLTFFCLDFSFCVSRVCFVWTPSSFPPKKAKSVRFLAFVFGFWF